jgi:uracil-DNA glycosylase
MSTKLSWESFSPLFGESWAEKFKPFFDNSGFDSIYERLKKDGARGKRIAPLPSNVFRCFKETPFDDLKVILIGMCPYHTFAGWSDRFIPNADVNKPSKIYPVADGLLMSCSITKRLQPSLNQFYDALEIDTDRGLNLTMKKDPDLSYLAHQGVLLLNAGLTVEEGKPGSHNELWEPFMKFLFEEVLTTNGVPIVILGKEASKVKRYIMPFTWVFELSHPASAAYNNTQWDSKGTFTNVNKILKENNGSSIQWIQTE